MARNRKVSLADLSVLIHCLGVASRDEDIGFVDADRTQDALLRALSPFVWVPDDVLESALYYANMLDEKQAFTDFRGNSFDQLAGRIGKFNKTYNYFTE